MGTIDLATPTANLAAAWLPDQSSRAANPPQETERSLDEPVGVPALAELARMRQRAAVICDDMTRPTPAYLAQPTALERLESVGLSQDQIRITLALGTHRPMTHPELEATAGQAVMAPYRLVNSELWFKECLRYLGEGHGGGLRWGCTRT